MSISAVAGITTGDALQTNVMADVHQLFLLQEHEMFPFNLNKCRARSMECSSLFVQTGVNYPKATISMMLMKFMSYTAVRAGSPACGGDVTVYI